MDRGAWWATVHGVANSRTLLSDYTILPQHLTSGIGLAPQEDSSPNGKLKKKKKITQDKILATVFT